MAPLKNNRSSQKKISKSKPKIKGKKNSVSRVSKNSSLVFRPDTKQTDFLVKIGRISAAKAIRESKALGLSIMYIKDGFLYSETANGEIENLGPVSKQSTGFDSSSFRKGMIFHAKD